MAPTIESPKALTVELSVAIMFGGLIAWAVSRYNTGRAEAAAPDARPALKEARFAGDRNGLLYAAGLITGEALIGILLAIPIVVTGRADALAFWGDYSHLYWPGSVLLVLVMFGMYRVASGETRRLG